MAKIALRAYHREIEGLIESNQSEEALAHCRYIFQSFPKYLETYSLMGKVFLENQRYGEASDVFQRMLSSMPDDFVAHVGMSMIRQDEGNMDAAIWHMERAFEVQPANSAIQGELKRLYGRRDGLEPSKIRLTRGALARMYLKGGLYHQAVAELRAALAEDNQRPDLQVLLATAYFQAGQRVEAVEACSSLLKKLPYCFEANRILACILPETDRAKDADIYRQRVISLDPYFVNLKLTTPTSENVPDQAIVIDRLAWQAGDKASAIDSSQPTWARDIGVSFKSEEALPDWLTEGGESDQAAGSSFSAEQTSPFTWDDTSEETAQATQMTEEEIPDWMREAGWGTSTGTFKEGPVDFDTPLADEAPAGDGDLVPADVPDWLRSMAPEGTLDQAEDLPPREETLPWLQEAESTSSDTVADWLGELGGVAQTPTVDATAAPAEMPDWLKDLSPTQTEAASEPTLEAGEMPDWLQGLASTPSEPVAASKPAIPAGDMPDWLQGLDTSAPSSPAVSEPAAPTADISDWLQGLESEESPLAEAQSAELPDWLKAMQTGDNEQPEAPAIPDMEISPAVSQPAAQAADMPDWLQSLDEETPQTAAQSADLPDWLKTMQTGASEQTETAAAPGLETSEPGLDWLQDFNLTETPSTETSPAEATPDWLTSLEAETPQAAPTTIQPPAAESLPPEWLLEADIEATPLATGITGTDEETKIPDWLGPAIVSAEKSSGVTGFLASINPQAADAETPTAAGPSQEESAELSEADALAWLDGLMSGDGISEDAMFTSTEEKPSAPVPAFAEQMPVQETAAPETDGLPDWLQTVAEEAQIPAEAVEAAKTQPPSFAIEEAATGIAAEEQQLPDWLLETMAQEAAETNAGTETVEVEAETPAWLAAVEAEADQFETQQVAPIEPEVALPTMEAVQPEAAAPEMPDLSDEGAAMAWLEALAAKQGVSEDELFTSSEARTETPPAWVAADVAATPVAAEPTPSEELPDWLLETIAQEAAETTAGTETAEAEAETPAWLAAVEAEADQFEAQQVAPIEPEVAMPTMEAVQPEAAAPEMPDLSDEGAAMAWLEALAAKQGVSEDELFTSSEARTETPPAWVAADVAATPVAAEPTAGEELPDWLLETIAQEAAETATGTETAEAEAETPAWLAAAEAEADQFEAQQVAPIEPEVALPTMEAAQPEAAAPEMPDLSDEGAAMAWLEALAAKQGVSEDELFTSSEARTETPPAWVAADVAATPVAAEPTAGEELPDWLLETIAQEAAETAAGTETVEVEAETPAWLAAAEVEADQFEAQQVAPIEPEVALPTMEAAQPEAAAPEMPDLSDEGAAMAWLEALAAKQGVSEDELFTSSEARTETPPAWVAADVAATPVAAEPTAGEELPDWLLETIAQEAAETAPVEAETSRVKEIAETTPESELPAWLLDAEAENAEPKVEMSAQSEPDMGLPDFTDESAAMAWLEGLATKQGVSEDELFTPVEDRPETPPAWVQADVAQAQAVAEPVAAIEPEDIPLTSVEAPLPTAAEKLPSFQQGAEEAAKPISQTQYTPPAVAYEAAEPIIQQGMPEWLLAIAEESEEDFETEVASKPEPLSDWLTAIAEEPAEEAVTQATPPPPPPPPVVKEVPAWQQPTQVVSRAELKAAMPQAPAEPPAPIAPKTVDTRLDVNTASLVQLEALPGIGFILAQNIINYRETYGAFNNLDDLQKVSGVGPATIEELRQWLQVVAPRPTGRLSVMAAPLGGALEEARVHLAQSDPNTAAQIYSQLLRSGHPVYEIIGDLQNALYRYPVDIALLQVLGEAYLLNDQLQEALEAYTKAEELLR